MEGIGVEGRLILIQSLSTSVLYDTVKRVAKCQYNCAELVSHHSNHSHKDKFPDRPTVIHVRPPSLTERNEPSFLTSLQATAPALD